MTPKGQNHLLLAGLALLLPQQIEAKQPAIEDERAAFREAVDDYQIFVVPHCTPDTVRAYVAARTNRDRAFVKSLRKAELEADYRQAVADRAERDNRTVYECFGPPPPPPPPGTTVPSTSLAQSEVGHSDGLAEHFAEGDRQFAVMMRLRDAMTDALRRR